jgi:hypothetical protein
VARGEGGERGGSDAVAKAQLRSTSSALAGDAVAPELSGVAEAGAEGADDEADDFNFMYGRQCWKGFSARVDGL